MVSIWAPKHVGAIMHKCISVGRRKVIGQQVPNVGIPTASLINKFVYMPYNLLTKEPPLIVIKSEDFVTYF